MFDEVKPKNAYKISLLLSFIYSIIVFFYYLLSSIEPISIHATEGVLFAFSKLVFIPLLGLYALGYLYMRSTGIKKTIVGWVMILEPPLIFSTLALMFQPTEMSTCGSEPIKFILYLRYVIDVLFIILLPYLIFNSSLFYLLKSKKELIWSFVLFLWTILIIGILLIY